MKENIKLISGYLQIAIIIAFLCSCNSVRKSTTKHTSKTDSTATVNKDSGRVVKVDSSGTKTDVGTYEILTEYLYDTVYLPGDSVVKYVPRIIKVYEKGTYNKSETASKSSSDSSGANVQSKVVVRTEKKDEVKTKETSRLPWWLWVVGIAGVGVIGVSVYRKYA